jgi:hypothetical protein
VDAPRARLTVCWARSGFAFFSLMRKHSTRIIVTVLALFGLGWLNILFPMIRFSYWMANELVGFAILTIPLLLLVSCFFLASSIYRNLLIILLSPVIPFCLLFQLFVLWDLSGGEEAYMSRYKQLERISTGESTIIAYHTVARDSWGIQVYQEMPLAPGIKLVKILYNGKFGEGHGEVRVELVETPSERILRIQDWDKEFLVPIRRFLYF